MLEEELAGETQILALLRSFEAEYEDFLVEAEEMAEHYRNGGER